MNFPLRCSVYDDIIDDHNAGNAEWENGPSHKFLRVFLKAPEILAKEIYQWATDNLLLGTMATIYELHAGEDKDTGILYLLSSIKRISVTVLFLFSKQSSHRWMTYRKFGADTFYDEMVKEAYLIL